MTPERNTVLPATVSQVRIHTSGPGGVDEGHARPSGPSMLAPATSATTRSVALTPPIIPARPKKNVQHTHDAAISVPTPRIGP